jgi:hypothetical protein
VFSVETKEKRFLTRTILLSTDILHSGFDEQDKKDKWTKNSFFTKKKKSD